MNLVAFRDDLVLQARKEIADKVIAFQARLLRDKNGVMDLLEEEARACFEKTAQEALKKIGNETAVQEASVDCFRSLYTNATERIDTLLPSVEREKNEIMASMRAKYDQLFQDGLRDKLQNLESSVNGIMEELKSVPDAISDALLKAAKDGRDDAYEEMNKTKRRFAKPMGIVMLLSAVLVYIIATAVSLALWRFCVEPKIDGAKDPEKGRSPPKEPSKETKTDKKPENKNSKNAEEEMKNKEKEM
ncbi:hypothetical protein QR680_008907 [Steinernema hermaphroditum]|uniref:Uncharacterized protein n=1 Tax=Steinernema hermaphroditum TaxID=289476 RepID=A0AA39IK88_9BILA|nr:hypothetical protein QR680_008907 [Steinernema hermaphroditum]